MKRACARRLSALIALVAAGCATAPTSPPALQPPPAELSQYLVDPTLGTAELSPGLVSVREAHSRLLRTGDAVAVSRGLENLLTTQPELAPARVVLAQALLVSGSPESAVAAARAAGSAVGLARELVLGRALEAAEQTAEAAVVFQRVAQSSPAARAGADRLRSRASSILAARVADLTARGRYAEAERALTDLELLQPTAARTVELRLDIASATGDRSRELELLRQLAPDEGAASGLRLRRANLELEIGDAAAGLAIVQGLAAAAPNDTGLAEQLRRAQFRWRVVNAPEAVRVAASLPQISRADGAVLLYWCLPQVRTGGGGEARIASDILDHPSREEIVRVVNLGLLSVDDTLHTFTPDRPLRRSELLVALLRVLARDPQGAGCVGAGSISAGDGSHTCERAAGCALVPSLSDCLASGALSGAEALEMIRRATERLERP